MSPYTNILLEEDRVLVTNVNESGVKSVVNTNIQNIQDIFMKERAMETPLLPSQWGVVKYYKKNNYEGFVLTTPPAVRDVKFSDGYFLEDDQPREITISVPPQIWIFEVKESPNGSKTLTHSMFYALKHELLSLKDNVFHAPFPNIGISHGICWGRELPEVVTAKSIQNIPARFFNQNFNNDLASNRVTDFTCLNSEGDEFVTDNAVHHMYAIHKDMLIAKAQGEEYVYPYHQLKNTNEMTAEEAIRNWLPNLFN